MNIIEATSRNSLLIEQLLGVWESSVKATHLFLSESEIEEIKEYVPQALRGVAHLIIAEDKAGRPVAFMGIEDGSLEMLFLFQARLHHFRDIRHGGIRNAAAVYVFIGVNRL